MAGNLYLPPFLDDSTIGANEEGRALDSHVLATVHALFDPDAVCLDRLPLRVGGERHPEIVFRLEFVVGFFSVGGNPDDLGPGFGERLSRPGEIDRLQRATAGVILRIKVDDDLLSCERGKLDAAATVGRQVEVRGLLALGCGRHPRLPFVALAWLQECRATSLAPGAFPRPVHRVAGTLALAGDPD